MTPSDLQSLLDARGLRTKDSARVLRIDRTMLWRLLNGERSITADRADLIRMRLAEYDEDPWAQRDRVMAQTQSKRSD